MDAHKLFVRLLVIAAVIAVSWGVGQRYVQAQASAAASTGNGTQARAVPQNRLRSVTPAQREAAAAQHRAKIALPAAPVLTPGGTPDYFTVPNWANSPLPIVNLTSGAITGGIRKFVDKLPGLGPTNANNLGQYLPVANPDTITYPGSDYYEIALIEYAEQMHSDLPPTKLRGYVQLNNGTDPLTGLNTVAPAPVHYLGPIIVAQRDRPVRVKFTNKLPSGSAGNLFIPVDTSVMGAGMGPLGMNPPVGPMEYTQNRGTIHLHGGNTPWISDGTPHQWITPAGEVTSYPKGVSVQNVPDMPDPGDGSQTFFYTNQQSARLMFYHDHAYGITRLNVYAGEAAGFVLTDPTEQQLITAGTIPVEQIPLIIQDKTFVPDLTQLATTDPTWDPVKWGGKGNLWFPHVYMPNQNPNDITGVNPFGRWDYGPWFWPPVTAAAGLQHDAVTRPDGTKVPGFPDVSMVMEAFMDTPVINGTAYPFLPVQRKAYRFRILNACDDRSLNLQLYYAKSATPDAIDPVTGLPTLQKDSGEVPMVPAAPGVWPANWPAPDGRTGGVPDPAKRGPAMIQIGTEGGFLPAPVVLHNIAIGYDMDRRSITFGNVKEHALMLGPAERADVIIDFSQVPAGAKLILYNDAPAPCPGFDPRVDYYTGNPDLTTTGGAPSTLPGYGPNTRTLMQFQVAGTPAVPFVSGAPDSYDAANLTALNTALPAAFAASQDPIIVPQKAYGGSKDVYAKIQDTSFTFTPTGATTPLTIPMQPKAIQELFELDYGRMNGTLGVELPLTNFLTQTTIPFGYIDPATEVIEASPFAGPPVAGDGTQIWKITHNGVDTHAIHVHLFNMQLINRVDWAGVVKPPDPNELGWKDTIRMNPLEDAIVALRPVAPALPFAIPDSIRPLDPTMPLGSTMGFTNVDPLTGQPPATTVTNELTDFGWEYVWHCHLLSHEEMDMMRPIVFNVPQLVPPSPSGLAVTLNGVLTWTDPTPASTSLGNPANEIGFMIDRSANGGAFVPLGKALANATSYTDNTIQTPVMYAYQVTAYNQVGVSAPSNVAIKPGVPGAPTNVTAGGGDAQATVTFRAPTSNGGSPITSYTVTSTPGNISATGFASPITITGLTNGTAYTFTVQATNIVGSGPASVPSNAVTPIAVTTLTLTANPPSPQSAFTPITLKATATGGFNLEYQFRCGYQNTAGWQWSIVQDYTGAATCVWTPTQPGPCSLMVLAREKGSTTTTQATLNYTVNTTISAVKVTANPPAPLAVNTPITLTATPTGGTNIEYQFRCGYQTTPTSWSWSIISNYSTTPTCLWTPTVPPRHYTITVWAREQGCTAAYQAYASLAYRTTFSPITSVTFTANPLSPQKVNTPVTLSVSSVGGTNLEYQFRIGYQDAAGWHWSGSLYGSTQRYTWTPTVTRTYSLVVYVREVGTTAPYTVYKTIIYKVNPSTTT